MPYRPIRRKGPGVQGVIYLLHFPHPYCHATHYRGWCGRDDVQERMAEHVKGRGNPLVYAMCQQEGITSPEQLMQYIAELRPGSKYDERKLKNRGGASKTCPVCKSQRKGRTAHEGHNQAFQDADQRVA